MKGKRRVPGFAKKLREWRIDTWIKGRTNWPAPVIARGWLWKFHPEKGHATLRCKDAYIQCRWYEQKIPPEIRVGDRLAVIGTLTTTGLGEHFYLAECVVLKPGASYASLMKEFYGLVDRYILPVNAYVEQPEALPDDPPRLLLSDVPERVRGIAEASIQDGPLSELPDCETV